MNLLAVNTVAVWFNAAKDYPFLDRLVGLLVALEIHLVVETFSTYLVK